MNKIIEWFTKKNVLVISLLGSLIFFCVLFYINNFYLKADYSCGIYCDTFWIFSLIFIPILIGSIITYKMKSYVFSNWIKFTFWFFIFSFLILLLVPFKCDVYLRICKESLTWFFSVIYSLISLILIIFKSLEKEKREKGVRNL